jgi:hypothetical protein
MYYNENEWVKGTAKPTSSFKSAEPRMLPTKAPASDAFYDAPAEKVHGAILDSNQPRLLPIKSETPGPGEYDSAKATASGKEASFSADQKKGAEFGKGPRGLPLKAAATDAMYYHDALEEKLAKDHGHQSSAFKSAEPRMLPTKAPASDAFYDAPAEKVHGAILDSKQPRLLPIRSGSLLFSLDNCAMEEEYVCFVTICAETPGVGTYRPQTAPSTRSADFTKSARNLPLKQVGVHPILGCGSTGAAVLNKIVRPAASATSGPDVCACLCARVNTGVCGTRPGPARATNTSIDLQQPTPCTTKTSGRSERKQLGTQPARLCCLRTTPLCFCSISHWTWLIVSYVFLIQSGQCVFHGRSSQGQVVVSIQEHDSSWPQVDSVAFLSFHFIFVEESGT